MQYKCKAYWKITQISDEQIVKENLRIHRFAHNFISSYISWNFSKFSHMSITNSIERKTYHNHHCYSDCVRFSYLHRFLRKTNNPVFRERRRWRPTSSSDCSSSQLPITQQWSPIPPSRSLSYTHTYTGCHDW